MRLWGPSKTQLELDEVVRSSAKGATQFEAIASRPGEIPSIIGTRFGGIPYAEAGDAWPMLDGRPYDFVGQFNLSECSEPPTAAYDLITVFISWHALEIDEPMERICVVRSYRSPSAAKAIMLDRPAPTGDEDFQVVPCTAKARRAVTYPRRLDHFEPSARSPNWPASTRTWARHT